MPPDEADSATGPIGAPLAASDLTGTIGGARAGAAARPGTSGERLPGGQGAGADGRRQADQPATAAGRADRRGAQPAAAV